MDNRNDITMTEHKFSRRKFIQWLFKYSSIFLGVGFFVGCGQKEESTQFEEKKEQAGFGDICDDLSNVRLSEVDKRDVYGYVDETPYPEYRCDNCSLFIPPKEGEDCGGCVLFEGPVFAEGYCDYWAPEE